MSSAAIGLSFVIGWIIGFFFGVWLNGTPKQPTNNDAE